MRDLKQHVNKLKAEGNESYSQIIKEYLANESTLGWAIKDPQPTSKEQLKQDIRKLFELGGVISGGAVLSHIHQRPIKDIDFYFNNEMSFIKAYLITFHNPYIDVCWYFDKPHELHDLSAVMVNIYPDQRVEITPQAQEAWDTGVCEVYLENLIWPERTAKRMLKYNKRYGLKFKKHQALSMAALFNFKAELFNQIIEISI